jgi:Sporulation and spore germination
MRVRLAPIAGWALLAVALLVGVLFHRQPWQRTERAASETGIEGRPAPDIETVKIGVELYFPGGDDQLHPETHSLEIAADAPPEEKIRTMLQALLEGPESDALRAPLPTTTVARKVYLPEDGIAIVDLASPDGAGPPAMGSQQEILIVYSLVNSIVYNFSEVQSVVLLWNGNQPLTLAGHLSLTRPLTADPELVARSPSAPPAAP